MVFPGMLTRPARSSPARRGAAAVSRIAAKATRFKRVWLWLTAPVLVYPNPPTPDERNTAGLGWRGGRPQYRPFCDHKHWNFKQHGRHCTCGALMADPGD